MCPAEVHCPDGRTFIVPEGVILDERIGVDFEHIPENDQKDLEWDSVIGTKEGYEILGEGKQPVTTTVTTHSITSSPEIEGRIVGLDKHGVFELTGGTKISPISE